MPHLQSLYLQDNNLSSIGPLHGALSLETLNMAFCKVVKFIHQLASNAARFNIVKELSKHHLMTSDHGSYIIEFGSHSTGLLLQRLLCTQCIAFAAPPRPHRMSH